MDIGQRLRSAREKAGLTQSMLSKTSGVSERTIKSYEKDNANVTISIIEKLAKALNVETKYFTNDDVQQYVHHSSSNMSTNVHKLSSTHQVVNEVQQRTTVKVNYYPNILASAGFGTFNHDVNVKVLELEEGFLMALGLKCFKNLDLITVYGDSMEPFVSNGELIILQRDVEAQNSDIVVANINGEVYVKKLQRDPIKKWIKLTSLNAMYPDIDLKEDELKYLSIVGIVRAKIRPF
ncbi:MAG: LexA family transcriptional regulator [Sulfurospirillaceae bacterium]|jgi:phage repressor protein C with HTH and peptisase S24 domain|nr:LexA family transcriptional regulator [Sulfurospirillaceae bacterium]